MLYPTVHTNGTSREELLQQALDASAALKMARAAMQAAAPHGRDYYVQGMDAYADARKEHEARIQALDGLHSHYYDLALSFGEA